MPRKKVKNEAVIKPVRAKLSRNTRSFLRGWLDWVEAGAKDERPFMRDQGLCHQAKFWFTQRETREAVQAELETAFMHAARQISGADPNFPFGRKTYYDSTKPRRMIADPDRLAWVRAQFRSTRKD